MCNTATIEDALMIQSLAGIWEGQGGSAANVVPAVAVAFAESGGDASAVDAAGPAYGIWQILGPNLAAHGLNPQTALNPTLNAQAAIAMSDNGSNWALWETAWAGTPDYGADLPTPQVGSCAGDNMGIVAQVLAGVQLPAGPSGPTSLLGPPGAALPPIPDTTDIQAAWSGFANLINQTIPAFAASLQAYGRYLGGFPT